MNESYPIARELLNAELAKLLVDHFADRATKDTTCLECRRARAVALELRQLHKARRGASRV